jgi:hypothetical protein
MLAPFAPRQIGPNEKHRSNGDGAAHQKHEIANVKPEKPGGFPRRESIWQSIVHRGGDNQNAI